MGFDPNISISAATVFAQGLLSFFSPCVLPLLPLYIGYLSGGAADDTGTPRRGRIFLNTFFFVLGISAAFFLLGFAMSAVGQFFGSNRMLFARIGGVIVILFGLYQLGVFGQSAALEQERRLPLRLDRLAISPLTALVMGFVFSFAWTPCVGPALSSVLLMAASSASRAAGMLLIGVYTLGFCIPFLAVGLFTTTLLDLFRAHRNVVRWTQKIGGALLVVMGIMMLTGYMNRVTGYLSLSGAGTAQEAVVSETAESAFAVPSEEPEEPKEPAPQEPDTSPEEDPSSGKDDGKDDEPAPIPAIDFTLKDQYGNEHTLSDYKGKVVFLNFWATWCPPCRSEMPDIQRLYEKYSAEEDPEVVILSVAMPGFRNETDEDGIREYMDLIGCTYPVLMDRSAEVYSAYRISGMPTTFLIDRDGNFFGYVPGFMSAEIMQSAVDQTLAGVMD